MIRCTRVDNAEHEAPLTLGATYQSSPAPISALPMASGFCLHLRATTSAHRLRVYVCHPGEDPEANAQELRRICRALVEDGHLPIAPPLYLPAFVDELTERELAIDLRLELVAVCDELRVYGGAITARMRREIEYARALGLPVRFTAELWS